MKSNSGRFPVKFTFTPSYFLEVGFLAINPPNSDFLVCPLLYFFHFDFVVEKLPKSKICLLIWRLIEQVRFLLLV